MNYLKTAVLLAVLTALLVFLGDLVGGRQGAVIALVFAGVMNFVTYWYSDKIVLKMYKARKVEEGDEPGLYGMVRDLAMKASIPMPGVYMIDNETPNAFATGRNPKHAAVAVTTGIMKLLDAEELTGVLGHELAHVSNRDILISTIAATIAGAISYLSHMAYFAALFGGGRHDNRQGANPLALIIMTIVAPLAAMLIQMAVSRSREYGADLSGAKVAGNPIYLANALRKLAYYNKRLPMENVSNATAHLFIVNPLRDIGVAKLFSTHPPIEDRIKRLEAMTGR